MLSSCGPIVGAVRERPSPRLKQTAPSECSDPRLGALLVLVYCAAAHAYRTGYFLPAHQRDTASGVGLARTTIHDPVMGPVGAAAQSLLVAER